LGGLKLRMLISQTDAVLLLAHGTISAISELPAFLTEVRRGRTPSPELVSEMAHRYERIGGSPLLEHTRAQAAGLSERLGCSVEVAMRLWQPRVEQVVPRLIERGVRRVCLLPLAPFSVEVYVNAAREAVRNVGISDLEFVSVGSWGNDPAFTNVQAELIDEHLASESVLVLTAHSLPMRVINMGDRYAEEVSACAAAIQHKLGRPVKLAYQSKGADGGEWLGPDLDEVLTQLAQQGVKAVTIAPFGFLSDHVETLYDLDIESKQRCESLGIELTRVPALNTRPAFLDVLADLVRRVM
jgi:protoporphyrin/coproporphyrin ferrochelatase